MAFLKLILSASFMSIFNFNSSIKSTAETPNIFDIGNLFVVKANSKLKFFSMASNPLSLSCSILLANMFKFFIEILSISIKNFRKSMLDKSNGFLSGSGGGGGSVCFKSGIFQLPNLSVNIYILIPSNDISFIFILSKNKLGIDSRI